MGKRDKLIKIQIKTAAMPFFLHVINTARQIVIQYLKGFVSFMLNYLSSNGKIFLLSIT